MKILLANNTLSLLAGSETWTETLAMQLKKIGHDVEAFSPELGVISDRLRAADITCHADMSPNGVVPFSYVLEEKRDYNYDIIIANHNHIVDYLRSQFPNTPIISTIHGIIHTFEEGGKQFRAPEHPAIDAKVNQFVAVSEEVQKILKENFNIDAMIIRNFFDAEKYKVERPISPDKPKVFLINTNYAGIENEEVQLIKSVAKHYDAQVIAVGMNFQQSADLLPMIEKADVVVGMGRSVLEGVVAGRLGIVNGRWGTGGIVNEQNINDLRHFNFSGRNSGGILMTSEQMIAEIDKNYNLTVIEWSRNYMLREHNVVHAAETFVQTAKNIISKPVEQEVIARPYRRANS